MERGTTFTQAITNSPLCAPARACLAQGREYENCGVYNNNFCTPPEVPTFYRALRDGGYQVGGVGKFDLHKPLMYWGEKGWLPQLGELGFSEAMDHEGKWDAFWASENPPRGPYGQYLSDRGLLEIYWEDFLRRYYDQMDTQPTGLPEDAYADNWETDAALAMLGRFAEKKNPWFAMVNFSGPHDPWDITEEMGKAVRDREMPLPPGQKDPDGRIRAVRRNYAGMLENIDRNLGRLLAFLEETNQLEHTVILYASDHGEMLGDRGRFYKSVPFEPSVRIPMVLSGPGILPGRRCDALVQLNDLAATIAEIAGVSFDGQGSPAVCCPWPPGKTPRRYGSINTVPCSSPFPRRRGAFRAMKTCVRTERICTEKRISTALTAAWAIPAGEHRNRRRKRNGIGAVSGRSGISLWSTSAHRSTRSTI